MLAAVVVLVAYLVGSVSFAVIVSRVFGLPDPRGYGSGNPGATNVLRSGRKGAALLTLIGDGAKGWVAVALAQWFAPGYGHGDVLVALAAVAVFMGHLYPVFFRFEGGKGVATAAGILLALDPWLALCVFAVWLAFALGSRLSSVGALAAAAATPPAGWWLLGAGPVLIALSAIAVLLVWRHRSNVGKLLAGTEGGFGRKPPAG